MLKNKIASCFLLITLLINLSGCASQLTVTLLQPAEIDINAKNIAVLAFKNDHKIGLTGEIESALTEVRFEGKPYFTVINRRSINNVIREQKLQYSGLLNENTSVEVGALLGAEALISGEITSNTKTDHSYQEKRWKCKKKSCYAYTVNCIRRRIHLGVNIRIVNVTLGSVLYSKSVNRSNDWRHCSDDNRILPSKEEGALLIAQRITKNFVLKLKPHYINAKVTLLESEDIEYNEHQKSLLKYGLEYLRQKRFDKAEQLLTELLASTGFKSYVAAYDLGVVKEVQGQLLKAQGYYDLADRLQVKPVKEINQAVTRVSDAIEKNTQAQRQVSRNLAR